MVGTQLILVKFLKSATGQRDVIETVPSLPQHSVVLDFTSIEGTVMIHCMGRTLLGMD